MPSGASSTVGDGSASSTASTRTAVGAPGAVAQAHVDGERRLVRRVLTSPPPVCRLPRVGPRPHPCIGGAPMPRRSGGVPARSESASGLRASPRRSTAGTRDCHLSVTCDHTRYVVRVQLGVRATTAGTSDRRVCRRPAPPARRGPRPPSGRPSGSGDDVTAGGEPFLDQRAGEAGEPIGVGGGHDDLAALLVHRAILVAGGTAAPPG